MKREREREKGFLNILRNSTSSSSRGRGRITSRRKGAIVVVILVAHDGVGGAAIALHVVVIAVPVAEALQKVGAGKRAGHLLDYITTGGERLPTIMTGGLQRAASAERRRWREAFQQTAIFL